jgi:hypothetical protein
MRSCCCLPRRPTCLPCAAQVTGTVVRTGSVKMFESQKLYECNKCKER